MKAPFTLYKRQTKSGKPRFYVRFREADGTRGSAISTGQTTLGAATTWAASELTRRAAAAKPVVPTLAEWAAPFWVKETCPYCTRRAEEGHAVGHSYLTTMRRLLVRHVLADQDLASKRLDEIRRDDLLKLRTRVAQSGRAVANMTMVSIRIVIKEAVFRGLIGADPTAGIGKMSVPKRMKGILTPAEISALLQRDPWGADDEHLAFVFAATTGMRTGEIRAVAWGQIDFERRRVAVTRAVKAWTSEVGTPKNGRPRTAPLPKPLEDALRDALKRLPSPPGPEDLIMPAKGGGPHGAAWFRGALLDACARLRIDAAGRHIAPHSIRSAVATWLIDAGADRRKIQAALGWADERTMNAHYVREEALDLSGLREALEQLPSPGASNPE